jgi:hypothetical protein
VKVRLKPPAVRAPVPVKVGNVPVAPAYVPVPLVMVAFAVPAPPVKTAAGIESVPVSVLPPLRVIVKPALKLPDESTLVKVAVAINAPLPILLRFAVPAAVMVVPAITPVAFTDKVVLTVAACDAAQSNTPIKKLGYLRVMF